MHVDAIIVILFFALLLGNCAGFYHYKNKYNTLKDKFQSRTEEQNKKDNDAYDRIINELNSSYEENKTKNGLNIKLNNDLITHKNTIAFLNSRYEGLTRHYILNRIALLEYQIPGYEGSSELLYKLDDLKRSNATGNLNAIDYLNEINSVFNQIK